MQKGGWIIGKNDEGMIVQPHCVHHSDDPNHEYSNWCYLPDILLEQIFSYLPVKDRYYASLVCRNWNEAFYMPQVWSSFFVDDQTLTRAKFNYYSGWQYVLDHFRTQNCLNRIGTFIRGLDFRPLHSFNNLYQFMTLISWYMEQGRKNASSNTKQIGDSINTLHYLFPCNMAAAHDPEGVKLFGTGGQLLAALKRLLSNLTHLRTLKLIDLMLERYDAKHLLDEVLNSCCLVLKVLHLVNVTTMHCPIMHVGLFLNLQILVISPQNIDDDVLILLADSRIRHLHLLQNRYTPPSICITPCNAKAWRIVKRDNSNLCVHLRVESTKDGEVLIQPEAPVYSIIYQTPKTQINSAVMLRIVDLYKTTLSTFGHESLPRFTCAKSFHSRADSLLLLMVRQCLNLTHLIIREKVSTSTVILLAKTGQNLRKFYVRRNAVIIRCEWPWNPEWSEEFYQWLKTTSKSYDRTEEEVSKIFGRSWTMLTDKQFRRAAVNVREGL
ncbi:F-box/LRR-repeat protein 3 [Pseudolycoriella hygida]|uniref:F-box/LRR-repeat protein 3 n=1 Tax=Pseudolycoriella hygida TaxID=35572 RepID=A0A9Q0NBR6_9DIPT|nr:F-box/LRR-repeat protein 3 [Pseudolycoriella hygida]